jgi:hypothetical protein
MGLLGSFNSIGRVLGPSMGGFAYVISMLLPYLGSAAIALASMAVVHLWAPGAKVRAFATGKSEEFTPEHIQ